mmetsp:Transcript_41402/g.84648  ORF Transcript_41402/g.84648 Transcript_41402/m.84648 type:complete len:103 (+) Transcript_41402:1076-1384(+)
MAHRNAGAKQLIDATAFWLLSWAAACSGLLPHLSRGQAEASILRDDLGAGTARSFDMSKRQTFTGADMLGAGRNRNSFARWTVRQSRNDSSPGFHLLDSVDE